MLLLEEIAKLCTKFFSAMYSILLKKKKTIFYSRERVELLKDEDFCCSNEATEKIYKKEKILN